MITFFVFVYCHLFFIVFCVFFFFFNDTATTEIYTLSLHDALPILTSAAAVVVNVLNGKRHMPGRWLRRQMEGHHLAHRGRRIRADERAEHGGRVPKRGVHQLDRSHLEARISKWLGCASWRHLAFVAHQ